ncbi:MAG: HyaD/HybD family hydrogenase maturation endopeptidase [Azonexus sp.]|nr:HyaD/HybD family hydrogenase maturation endopeptidase [Azonexus sp.]
MNSVNCHDNVRDTLERSQLAAGPVEHTPATPLGGQRDLPALRLVVLGIGNTLLGDDAVGIHVIRHLESRKCASLFSGAQIELVDGGTLGYLLIDRISEADGLIIIDSANINQAPGSVAVFTDQQVDDFLELNTSSSVHEVGLIDLLQMLRLNKEAPKRCALIGIQPELIDWAIELSPVVTAALPEACNAVEKILQSWLDDSENSDVQT